MKIIWVVKVFWWCKYFCPACNLATLRHSQSIRTGLTRDNVVIFDSIIAHITCHVSLLWLRTRVISPLCGGRCWWSLFTTILYSSHVLQASSSIRTLEAKCLHWPHHLCACHHQHRWQHPHLQHQALRVLARFSSYHQVFTSVCCWWIFSTSNIQ